MKQPGLTGIYFGLLANWTPGRQNLPGASREADPLNDTWERAGSLTPKKPQRAEETPGSPSPSQRAPNRGSQAPNAHSQQGKCFRCLLLQICQCTKSNADEQSSGCLWKSSNLWYSHDIAKEHGVLPQAVKIKGSSREKNQLSETALS